MDFQTSQIDLDSIETIAENEFSIDPKDQATAIEHLAHSIVKLRGLVRIPVVEQVRIDVYTLIAGHFDYYAYLKARELDPDLPDRLRVFIVNPKKAVTKEILTQLKAIERIQGVTMSTAKPESSVSEFDLKLSNLKDLFESKLDQLIENQQAKQNTSSQESKILELLVKMSEQISNFTQILGSFEQKLENLSANKFKHFSTKLPYKMLQAKVRALRDQGHNTPKLNSTGIILEEYLEKFYQEISDQSCVVR